MPQARLRSTVYVPDMAYVWLFSANFGDSEQDARAFAEKFDRTPFTVPSGATVYLRVSCEKWQEGECWECSVIPYLAETPSPSTYLNGSGGPGDDEEVADLDAAARVLYERLRSLQGYSYAMCGTEVGGSWLSPEELRVALGPGGDFQDYRWPEGLVLAQALGPTTPSFVPFSDGYVWFPFETTKVIPWS